MKSKIGVMLLTSFLAACGGASFDGREPVASSSSVSSSDKVASGKARYESQCATCHGLDGNGNGKAYLKINPVLATYQHSESDIAQPLADYIRDWMPSPGLQLCTDTCAQEITAYIRSWVPNSKSSLSSVSSNTSSDVSSNASSNVSSDISGNTSSNVSSDISSNTSSNIFSNVSSDTSSSVSNDTSSNTSSENASEMSSSLSSESSSISLGSESSSSESTESSESSRPADLLAGEALYQANCVNCHGATGGGRIPIDPAATTYKHSKAEAPQVPEEYLEQWMPPRGEKCAGDCAQDVVAFMRSWVTNNSQALFMGAVAASYQRQAVPIVQDVDCDIHQGVSGYRQLTRLEYVNSVKKVLGIDLNNIDGKSLVALLPNDYFENQLSAPALTGKEIYGFSNYRLLATIIAEKRKNIVLVNGRECTNQSGDCTDNLVKDVASLLRRDLSAYERTTINENSLSGYQRMLTAALTSPDFLLRDETGIPLISSHIRELTPSQWYDYISFGMAGVTSDFPHKNYNEGVMNFASLIQENRAYAQLHWLQFSKIWLGIDISAPMTDEINFWVETVAKSIVGSFEQRVPLHSLLSSTVNQYQQLSFDALTDFPASDLVDALTCGKSLGERQQTLDWLQTDEGYQQVKQCFVAKIYEQLNGHQISVGKPVGAAAKGGACEVDALLSGSVDDDVAILIEQVISINSARYRRVYE